MNPGQIEQVSEELAANLPVCPKCGQHPEIWKKIEGVPPRPKIAVGCFAAVGCGVDCAGAWPEISWHPSLFEAVNIWSLTAKLLGAETPQGVANMAGDGPPNFNGYSGCSLYVDNVTGCVYYWDGGQWEQAANHMPF